MSSHSFGKIGGAEEDRTPDLRIANATLSHLTDTLLLLQCRAILPPAVIYGGILNLLETNLRVLLTWQPDAFLGYAISKRTTAAPNAFDLAGINFGGMLIFLSY